VLFLQGFRIPAGYSLLCGTIPHSHLFGAYEVTHRLDSLDATPRRPVMMPKSLSHLTERMELVTNERQQYLVFIGLSLAVVALAAIAYFSDPLLFQKFLGRINPLIAVVVIALLGGILLSILLSRGWFAIYTTGEPRRFLLLSGVAALMGAIMILVDLRVVFSEDLNILFPQSVLYYPVMGYAVDILFHVLPLTILLILLTLLSKSFSSIIWPCILIVSLLEPVFQVAFLVGPYPSWAVAYVGLHIFAINLSELVLFKRYDFVSMYSFRLAYYAIWHIVWGYLRTRLLF
jgi:hypothetical protein